MFTILCLREIKNYIREPQLILQPILFFILTTCLFPIATGSDAQMLLEIAPAALWIPMILASVFSSAQLYYEDYHNGILSQDLIYIKELWLLILSKIFAAWLAFILPLILTLPLIALMLNFPMQALPQIILLLSIASFSLILIGSMGALLILKQPKSIFLQLLIALPFYFPVLIIGTIATHRVLINDTVQGETAILAAFTLFSILTIIPLSNLALKLQPLP